MRRDQEVREFLPPPEPSTVADLTSLAVRLTASTQEWAAWRGVTALEEEHDLDSVAPEDAWPGILDVSHAWMAERGFEALVVCRHVLGQLVLVGCGGHGRRELVQVDVVDRKLVHGAAVWSATDLLRCAASERGVRRLRPGCEGVARLLGDRTDTRGHELVELHPQCAAALSTQLGLGARLVTRRSTLARALLELLLAVRPLLSPRETWRSFASDGARERCVVLAALRANRRRPDDLRAWLDLVARDHEVARA